MSNASTRPAAPRTPTKKPMTKAEQRRRFEKTARELGCDNGEALDAAFGKIVPPKVPPRDKRSE
jgi:hypothetical protein